MEGVLSKLLSIAVSFADDLKEHRSVRIHSPAAFIRCMKRFAARRCLPRKFLSDSAKTFKSAAKVLRMVCDHPDV